MPGVRRVIPGAFPIEQAIGNEINRAVVGQITAKEALDNAVAAGASDIMTEATDSMQGKDPVDHATVAPGLYLSEPVRTMPF